MPTSFMDKIKPGLRALPQGTAFTDMRVLIATWFGAGRLKPASGTWGSLAAVPPGYVIYMVGGVPALAAAAVLLMVAGTWAAEYYGKKSGKTDDQAIVVDEVVGLWIAALPAENEPALWLAAFLLFRLFDVCKPWPAARYDNRSRGGFDVMMDDVVAGIYAMIGVAAMAVPYLLKK